MTPGQPWKEMEGEEYDFLKLYDLLSVPDIQYTPNYSDAWIEPTGDYRGGTLDDVPVQGLELRVLATESELISTVIGTLTGLRLYYDRRGEYPHHKIIRDKEAFDELKSTGGYGPVVVIHPTPDWYDGLTEHFSDLRERQSEDSVVAPNYEHALEVVYYLISAFIVQNSGDDGPPIEIPLHLENERGPSEPAIGRQIANTRIIQRYTGLGAENLFDPTLQEFDFNSPAGDTVDDVSFNPKYIRDDSIGEFTASMCELGVLTAARLLATLSPSSS